MNMTADGSRFVTVRREMMADLWSVTTGNPPEWKRWTTRFKPEDTVEYVARVDGDDVVYTTRDDDRFRLWRLSEPEGEPVPVLPETSRAPRVFNVSPDGKTLVYTASEPDESLNIYQVPSSGGTPRRVTSGGHDNRPSFCGNDAIIFTRHNEDGVWRVPLDGSRQPERVSPLTPFDTLAVCSPDAARIAFAAHVPYQDRSHREIIVISADRGEPLNQIPFPDGWGLRWHPNGRDLTFVSRRGGGNNIYAMSLPSGEVSMLTECNVGIFSYSWWEKGDALFLSRGGIDANVVMIGDASLDIHP